MPVMHMLWWKASPGLWLSDPRKLDSTSRFGLFNGGIVAISACGFLLEIVVMDSLLCATLPSGQFGF